MVNTALRDRVLKTSTLSRTSLLAKSVLYQEKDPIVTHVPMVNIALSGRWDGGLLPGLLQIAGPSKHFKTAFGLLLVTSFLAKYPDGIILFYDSEFGTPQSYFESFNINPENVIHSPITNVEELKFDITAQLKGLTEDDHIMIFVDSIGNLASLKEVEDAENQKSVADMSRAKQLKSLFRIVTPHLTLKGIPMVVVNHTYKELALYPKDIVGGGTGSYYSSNDIWIVGRQQDKDTEGVQGFHFVINIEKSRTVREKSKIPITVSFESGINQFSGLFDLACEGGFLTSPKKGKWCIAGTTQEFKEKDIVDSAEFWATAVTDEFKTYIEDKYRLSSVNMISQESDEEVAEVA